MNITEINGIGSIPRYYHVIATGIPLVVLTIVIPLILGKVIRMVIAMTKSYLTLFTMWLLLWGGSIGLYATSTTTPGIPGIPPIVASLSIAPSIIFAGYCGWKAWSYLKLRNRNGAIVYSVCALVTAALDVGSLFYYIAFIFGLLTPVLLSFLWWWEHRQRLREWWAKWRAGQHQTTRGASHSSSSNSTT